MKTKKEMNMKAQNLLDVIQHKQPQHHWWTTGSGYVELAMSLDQIMRVAHAGDCYSDASFLVRKEMKAQLKKLDKNAVRKTLKEFGTWSDEELNDHKENLIRLVWIAGNDLSDEMANDSEVA